MQFSHQIELLISDVLAATTKLRHYAAQEVTHSLVLDKAGQIEASYEAADATELACEIEETIGRVRAKGGTIQAYRVSYIEEVSDE